MYRSLNRNFLQDSRGLVTLLCTVLGAQFLGSVESSKDTRNFGGQDPAVGYLKQCQCYSEELPVEGALGTTAGEEVEDAIRTFMNTSRSFEKRTEV